MAIQKLVCFFHIPKTGGTAIRALLQKTVPRERYFWQHENNNPLGYLYLDQVPLEKREAYFNQLRFVGGHFEYHYTGVLRGVGIEPVFAAVVREPFSRVVSHYEFVEKMNGRQPTPEHFYDTFYKKTDFWNGQDSYQLFCTTGQAQLNNGIHVLNRHSYLLVPLANIQFFVTELAKYIPELGGNRLMIYNDNEDKSYLQKYDNLVANKDICEFLKEDIRFFEYINNQ
ncbi:hypothetical protein [Methylomagnum sp.]